MDALKLGPLVVPLQVALALAAVLLASLVASRCRVPAGSDASDVLWKMVLAGFGVARLVFVLRHWDLYQRSPLSMLDIRDGGFELAAGLLAAVLIGAELSRKVPLLRRALLKAMLTGCLVFFGGGAVNDALRTTGTPLPEVTLQHLDGSPATLAQLRGRPVVVNLWATWCPPCRRELPALRAAQLAHPEVAFVFVNQGEARSLVAAYLAERVPGIGNALADPAMQMSSRTGVAAYPTTLFYDARGKLALRHMGELSAATVEEKLGRVKR